MQRWHIAFVFLAAVLLSCNRSKLDGEYAAFVGSYDWTRTSTATGSGLSVTQSVLSQTAVSFHAAVELKKKGEIAFYKDGALISSNKYTLLDKESNSFGGKELWVKLKGKHGMNIPEDKLHLQLSGDTALSIDRFPFPAIGDVEAFKPGHRPLDSRFTKR